MCSLRLDCCVSVAFALALTACGGKTGDDAASAGDSAAIAGAAAQAGMPGGVMQPVTLTEADVEHFIAASKELQTLGVRAQDDLDNDPSKVQQFAVALQTNSEALAILRKHTFDVPRYQQVAYSVMMAYAAEDMKKAPSAAEMEANLESMKAQMSKEQFEQMKKMTAAANASMQAMQNQPQSNIDLVARYRGQIDALSKRK